jgi:hypothetical protein
MRFALASALGLALLAATPALAEDPPLPRSRPPDAGPVVPLPRPRPEKPAEAPQPAPETSTPAAVPKEDPPTETPHEPAEPRIYQVACPALLDGQVEAKALPPIADGQCRAQSPLSLTGVLVNGRMLPVSGGVVTDCGMASALPEWVSEVDNYLKAREKTELTELVVGTSYMCRNVNNASEGNLSFHGFADALDVVGFKLKDGRTVTVEADWGNATSEDGRLIRFAHDAACGHFTTTLGPEANALHHDHFHIDLGCHGKTCTARLCE